MQTVGIPRFVRDRVSFLWRSFVTGTEELGAWANHNRVVGFLLLSGILGITLLPVEVSLVYRVPIAIVVLSLATLNGAYLESKKRTVEIASDDAIIASFSDKTRGLLLSPWTKDLIRGDLSANHVEDSIVAELKEHGLITIAYVMPGPRGLAQYAVPHLNLTGDGSRILRKMRTESRSN